MEGKDQIAYLGAAINGMLDAAERSARSSEAFLDAVPDTIFRIDRDGSIIDARSPARLPLVEAADALVGQGTEEIAQLYPFISPERLERTIEATARALATGVPQALAFEVELDGRQRWFEERIVASGENEAVALVRDVSAVRRAEQAERQEVLLREIHHRVKNNLQVISSLLALQAGTAADPHTRSLLKESQDRVRSMALIHEKLYQAGAERGVSFAEYARDLAAHLRHSYAGDSGQVDLDVEVEDLSLDMDISVPCGLIINELVSNSLKHAFPGGRAGRVLLGLHREAGGAIRLSVRDDGVGLPGGHRRARPPHAGASHREHPRRPDQGRPRGGGERGDDDHAHLPRALTDATPSPGPPGTRRRRNRRSRATRTPPGQGTPRSRRAACPSPSR